MPSYPAPVPPILPTSILIVEDEAPIRDLLGQIFSLPGYTVTVAHNVAGAIAYISRAAHRATVIITDLDLPDGPGESVLDAARAAATLVALDGGAGYCPRLVVYSGSDDDERLAGLVGRGASAFVRKPSPVGELWAAAFPESA